MSKKNKCPFCKSTDIMKMGSGYIAEKERDVDLYQCFNCKMPFIDEEMESGIIQLPIK